MAKRAMLSFEKAGNEWIAWHRRIAWLLKSDASGQWFVYRLRNGEKAWTRASDLPHPTHRDAAETARALVSLERAR